jgi:hypothetical protein
MLTYFLWTWCSVNGEYDEIPLAISTYTTDGEERMNAANALLVSLYLFSLVILRCSLWWACLPRHLSGIAETHTFSLLSMTKHTIFARAIQH